MAESIVLTDAVGKRLALGEQVAIAAVSLPGWSGPVFTAVGGLPRLRAGMLVCRDADTPLLRVTGGAYLTRGASEPAARAYFAEALAAGRPIDGAQAVTLVRKGFSLAWITLSDKGFAGLRGDESGPLIAKIADKFLSIGHAQGFLLPDDPLALRALLSDLALVQGYDLIVTTGGTGLAPSDRTPEATLAVIERRLPGFETAMMATAMSKTSSAVISRAVCGSLGDSLIVNLPGSPGAVRENFAAIGPALAHAIEKLQGDPSDCARR